MPPRDRFINIGSFSSETPGPSAGDALEKLGNALFRNRTLDLDQKNREKLFDEQKRQFNAQLGLKQLAAQLEQSKSDKIARQEGNLLDSVNSNLPPGTAPFKDIGSSALSNVFSGQTKTRQEQAGISAVESGVADFNGLLSNNLDAARNPIAGAPSALDVPAELDPGFKPEPRGPVTLTPQQELEQLTATRQEFLDNKGDPRALQSPAIVAQFKSARDLVAFQNKELIKSGLETKGGKPTTDQRNWLATIPTDQLNSMSDAEKKRSFADHLFANAKDIRSYSRSLNKDFNALPLVKSFGKIDRSLAKIRTINLEGDQFFGKDGKPIGDISRVISDTALNVLFNKLIDEDSAVLPAEFARSEALQSVFQRLKGMFSKQTSGGGISLNDTDRLAIVKLAKNFNRELLVKMADKVDDYSGMATRHGANPMDVIGSSLMRRIKSEPIQNLLKVRRSIAQKTGGL